MSGGVLTCKQTAAVETLLWEEADVRPVAVDVVFYS